MCIHRKIEVQSSRYQASALDYIAYAFDKLGNTNIEHLQLRIQRSWLEVKKKILINTDVEQMQLRI